jgi:hypothetical protein
VLTRPGISTAQARIISTAMVALPASQWFCPDLTSWPGAGSATPLAVRDCLDQRGYERRSLVAENVCAKDRICVRVGVKLADTAVVLKWPTKCGFAVLLALGLSMAVLTVFGRHLSTYLQVIPEQRVILHAADSGTATGPLSMKLVP